MITRLRTYGWIVVLAILATFGVVALAQAAIPGEDGVIHGCYKDNSGSLRVVDDPGTCQGSETALSWNQAGPQGVQGEPGPQGDQGPPGSDADVHAYHTEAFTENVGGSEVVAFITGLPAGDYIVWATAVVTDDVDSLGMTCSLHVNNGGPILAIGGTANYSDGHEGFGQVDMVKPVSMPADGSTLFFTCGSEDHDKDVRARLTMIKVAGVN